MSKIGPNDPCPCGSGKKAKKCCATSVQPVKAKDKTEKNQLDGTMGLSGMPILINVVPFNKSKKIRPSPGGNAGKYIATFLLTKPNEPALLKENHLVFEFDHSQGDSHVFIGDPNELRAEFTANLPDATYEFFGYANERGYLSKIETAEFDADNIQDAMDKAINGLYPILSRIALLNNVPLYVYRFAVVEVRTRNHMSSFVLPFTNKATPMMENLPKEAQFETFASLYREALNSNSPNYQFLCYFKIIEGIRKLVEEQTARENQQILLTGKKPRRPVDILPSDPTEQRLWLSALFGRQKWSDLAIKQVFPDNAAGKKINSLIGQSKELDMVRNRIAHTVLRDESAVPITIDDGTHIREVNSWLPLCKCLALYLLKKEFPSAFIID